HLFCTDTATTQLYTLSLHDALPILEVLDAGDERRLARGFLKVAQLHHDGDWQPAPRAMPNLLRHLRAEQKLDVDLRVEDLLPTSPDLFSFKFLYMHGRKAFDVPEGGLENLRANLKAGG